MLKEALFFKKKLKNKLIHYYINLISFLKDFMDISDKKLKKIRRIAKKNYLFLVPVIWIIMFKIFIIPVRQMYLYPIYHHPVQNVFVNENDYILKRVNRLLNQNEYGKNDLIQY